MRTRGNRGPLPAGPSSARSNLTILAVCAHCTMAKLGPGPYNTPFSRQVYNPGPPRRLRRREGLRVEG